MASGWVRKKRGLFPDLADQEIEIVRGRGAGQRVDHLFRRDIREKAVIRIVDQLTFLRFLDRLDRKAQLLLNLIERARIEIADPGVDVDDRGDTVKEILARRLVVVDERLRQLGLVIARGASDLDVLGILDRVQTVDTSFDRNPLKQVHKPTWRNS